jgi:tetratricopeptide (TPR) repeat protein
MTTPNEAPHAQDHALLEVFCSYAEDDADIKLFAALEQRLMPLQRAARLTLHHRGQIQAGDDPTEVIKVWQGRASVILLLVSPAYLADNECEREVEIAMQSPAHVIPIILRPCTWNDTPFAGLQCLPRNRTPITLWRNQDEAWQTVVAELTRVLAEGAESLSSLPIQESATGKAPPDAGKYHVENQRAVSGQVIGDHATVHIVYNPPAPSAATAPTPPQRLWNVPFARNPFFTGREDLLKQLHIQLHTTQTAAVSQPHAVSGLGGVGKTQLALEYAYRYGEEYQAVLWARADTPETLNASYTEIAGLLHLPQRDAQEQEVITQAVKGWLSGTSGWLLILDNADELRMVPAFLPTRFSGHLLLTTRAQATGKLARRVEVITLDDEVGALLLLRRAGLIAPDASLDRASPGDRTVAKAITSELGGLPLALDQAGAYIEATGCGFTGYQRLYRQRRSELLQTRGGFFDDHPEPVATTWLISFERVEQQSPAAADLLRFCAFLAPDAIPKELLTEGAEALGETLAATASDPFLLNGAIEALRAYSLLSRDPEARTLTMHRLVQAVVRESMPIETQRQWMQYAVEAVNTTFPHAAFESWFTCEQLLTHALVCATWIEQIQLTTAEAARLLLETGSYLDDRARYTEAEPLYQRSLAIREKSLGPGHPDVAFPLNGLANLYQEQGKYKEAEPLYQRSLAIREKSLGPEHPDVASPLNNLALLYKEQGKFAEAKPLYQRALAIFEQSLGPEHPDVAYPLNNLAILYKEQGQFAEAELLYQRALAIREKSLGPEHPDVAYPLNNLASLYRKQGKYREAEPLYQRALHIWQLSLGESHPQVAYPLNNLAILYQEQGQFAEAESHFLRALSIREATLGINHPLTKTTRDSYADLLNTVKRQ